MVDQKWKNNRRPNIFGCNSCHNQEKDFQCWSSLRAVFGMMVPSCCGSSHGASNPTHSSSSKTIASMGSTLQAQLSASSVVTGTIFGQRKGRVNFCVQEDPASPPLLFLEFAIPTHLLIKEMQSGLLRITLECDKKNSIANDPHYINDDPHGAIPSLFAEPVWSMYCNGRKVGFAMKKTVKSADSDPAMANLMSLMQSVTSGAGVIPCRTNSNKHNLAGTLIRDKDGSSDKDADTLPNAGGGGDLINNRDGKVSMTKGGADNLTEDAAGGKYEDAGIDGLPTCGVLEQDDLPSSRAVEKPTMEEDELIYMRAKYERVVGSPDSEAFHMINPDGSQCQELSIFLTRS